jgi:hypothetical protein
VVTGTTDWLHPCMSLVALGHGTWCCSQGSWSFITVMVTASSVIPDGASWLQHHACEHVPLLAVGVNGHVAGCLWWAYCRTCRHCNSKPCCWQLRSLLVRNHRSTWPQPKAPGHAVVLAAHPVSKHAPSTCHPVIHGCHVREEEHLVHGEGGVCCVLVGLD